VNSINRLVLAVTSYSMFLLFYSEDGDHTSLRNGVPINHATWRHITERRNLRV